MVAQVRTYFSIPGFNMINTQMPRPPSSRELTMWPLSGTSQCKSPWTFKNTETERTKQTTDRTSHQAQADIGHSAPTHTSMARDMAGAICIHHCGLPSEHVTLLGTHSHMYSYIHTYIPAGIRNLPGSQTHRRAFFMSPHWSQDQRS